jgi:hypothetical protein
MARIELSNIGGGGTTLSLTTTGTSGASTLAGSVLNIPIYQGQLTLTTTGTSGAATLSGDILNIPQYSGGGGTPAGSAGQVQFNSTPAGSFAASANLAWDDSNVRLNIGAPSTPTGRLNVKGGGATSSTVNLRLTDSGNTELFKVLDNGNTNIGTGFNWDNTNGRLGIGTASPVTQLHVASEAVANATIQRSSNNISSPVINFRKTRGNISSPTGVSSGDLLGTFGFNGLMATGTYSDDFAFFGGLATGTVTSTSLPTSIFFIAGSSALYNTQFYIHHTGNSRFGSSSIFSSLPTPNAKVEIIGSNTTAGVGTFSVQDGAGTPSTIYRIDNDGKVTYRATNTAAGTTGAQTINRPSGTVNFLGGTSALVVTNSLCTTSSIVFATVRTNDATAYIKNVVPAAGSFTINLGANATAETSVGFFIIN